MCFLLLTGLASALGPSGRLYFTVGGADLLGTLEGSVENYTSTVNSGEGPIAVFGAVATVGQAPGGLGASYDLNGAPTGGIYSNPLFTFAGDGTTDGTSNYLIDSSGDVYATPLDFSTATPVFSAGAGAQGIAYDATGNGFWITGDGLLKEFDFAGNVVNAFALNSGDAGAVAYDPADHTLWVGGSVLTQYATDGTVLGAYALNSGFPISGMEFDLQPVPEPASLAAVGVGVLAVLLRRPASKKAQ